MTWTNYHSHCNFCDGTHPAEAYVQAAIENGFSVYGFSSHAPVPFALPWAMKQELLANYVAKIQRLKGQYADQIEILLSLESDFIPGLVSPRDAMFADFPFDYTLCSIHFVDAFPNGQPWEIDSTTKVFEAGINQIFEGGGRKAVERYFQLTCQMLETVRPDIWGHPDKLKMHNRQFLFFDETESWYKNAIKEALVLAKELEIVVEVNTRGLYKRLTTEPYPGVEALKEMAQMKMPVMLNSDAHHPQEIAGDFAETALLLRNVGFKSLRILKNGFWQDVGFNPHGLELKD